VLLDYKDCSQILRNGEKVMVDQCEFPHSIMKLLDACAQCRQIFHVRANEVNLPCKEIMEDIQQKLDQFGIELRNELRRVGVIEDFTSFPFEVVSGESEIEALQKVLQYYAEAAGDRVPLHARAMIRRQYGSLQEDYAQLLALPRVF
jgi:hypothetical protein